MEIPTVTYKKLLNDTSRVIRHQEEIARLKGETFNVFSILKMEHRENETHSTFLGEILNPKGSHGLGSIFLQRFLEQLDIQYHIDIASVEVKLEEALSKRDDIKVSGGRVDIFIKDGNDNTICIENKIYASDQNVQIARYCNFNSGKNKVYYLTLEGAEPPMYSCGDKKLDVDFFTLSYKEDIIKWLEQCQKEATQFAILRETIYQYAILIKKLTNQLSNQKMEKEVKDLIAANYKAATVIGSNIRKIELEYTGKFISEIKEALEFSLSKDFDINVDPNLDKNFTGISISNKHWPTDIRVKLEGSTKIPWHSSYYGVVAHIDKYDRQKIMDAMKAIDLEGFKDSDFWPCYKYILDFSTTDKRARLFKATEREALVKEIAEKLEEMANVCEIPFTNF